MEGFENLPVGPLNRGEVEYGALTAPAGHAAINGRHARTGERALHLLGGENRNLEIALKEPIAKETPCDFWMERWTGRPPFRFVLTAVTPEGEKQLVSEEKMGPGGYKKHVEVMLPAGTTALRFTCTSDEDGGILVDDFAIHTGPMVIEKVETPHPGAYPLLKRAPINPVLGVHVDTSGSESPQDVRRVELRVQPAGQVDSVTLRSSDARGTRMQKSRVFGTGKPDAEGRVVIDCPRGELGTGSTWLWLDARPSEESLVGSAVTFSDVNITIGEKKYSPQQTPVTQRIGYLLSIPGESVGNQADGAEPRPCKSFRIPGLIRTRKGTLIGCFDARYNHEGDLCADIDVAVVRSTDGGQTWTAPEVAMDSGPGVNNGNGDPCILQDHNGRIWLQSLACHFAGGASLFVSKPGFDEKSTGQWAMTYSDDDGKTWSRDFVNPTRQIKKEEWTCILAGPGCGITMKDGTIVFPAQIWQLGANPRCMSTICYSRDGGKNWAYGAGAPHSTSECQVVELQDGSLMLNCRNEARSGRRMVYVTRDLGKTWQAHESNDKTLSEPTCQASLVSVDTKAYGRLLLFSNPKSQGGRDHMTIRYSKDEGVTWSEGYEYDSRPCLGYSCIALTDEEHVGIIYEAAHTDGVSGMRGIGFIRIPLETVMTGEDVPARPASMVGCGKGCSHPEPSCPTASEVDEAEKDSSAR